MQHLCGYRLPWSFTSRQPLLPRTANSKRSSKTGTMAIARSAALLPLLSVFLLVLSARASSESPFLVVHKKADLARLKSGKEQITVSIDVYNQGSAIAYDVALADDSWDKEGFDLISGTTSKSWEKLETGGIVSHSFVLESKLKGLFHGAPAVVKFRVPSKSALQEAYSTPILPLDILADKPPLDKLNWLKKLVGKYGSLVAVLGLVGLFIYIVSSPPSASRVSKKKR